MFAATIAPTRTQQIAKHHYRILSRPAAVRVLDSVQIFELAEILDSAESALVVWTLRGWLAYNQTHALRRNYREGRWWTYNSLPRWCETRFKWLSCKQLGTIMARLEKQGVIIRKQFNANKLDNRYWYTVNEDVIAALAEAKRAAFEASSQTVTTSAQTGGSSAQTVTTSAQMVGSPSQMGAYTTKESSTQESTIHNLKTPPTTAFQGACKKAVVVVVPQSPAPGEIALNEPPRIEANQPAPLALEGNTQSDSPTIEPISKVPLKVLPSSALSLVENMMRNFERLGLTEDYATRLIGTYGEDAVRACHQFIQANWRQYPEGHKSRIHTPPGWMTHELATRRLNPPPAPFAAVVEIDAEPGQGQGESIDPPQSTALAQERTATTSLPKVPLKVLSRSETGVDIQVAERLTAGEVWGMARQQLISRDTTLQRWLQDARLLGYACVDGVGTYTVAVTLDHARTQMQQRYYRGIESVFKGLHNAPVRIEFEVGS